MTAKKGILGSVFTVGGLTACSRVLGLVREMLQARFIGAGIEQSAFTLAFAIPNMARKLFGEGALTAAFVPVFKGEVETVSLARASRLARAVMTMVILMLSAIVIIAMGSLELVVKFRDELGLSDMTRLKLTVRLVKTLLPYMVFICAAAFGMGVLNSLGRFTAAGFAPCILNVFWIGMLAWIGFVGDLRMDQRIHRVAMAILAAGAAQMIFLFVCMRRAGVSPGLSFRGWCDEKTRLVWRNIGLAALGAGAIQINYMLDQILAQLASPWAAGVIGYAERLMDLPLGVVAVAFGTVLLPTFSGFFARSDVAGARKVLTDSLGTMMFVMLPAAAGLFVLAPEVVRVIYEGGSFDPVATVRVSRALAVYALGLGFFGVQKSLIPWFQAQKDMKTPLRVSVVSVIVNAVLNVLAVVFLPVEWRHVGLAASTDVCAALGALLLFLAVKRRNGETGFAAAMPRFAVSGAAAGVMAIVLFALKGVGEEFAPLFALSGAIITGAAVYFGSAVALAAVFRVPLRVRVRGGA